MTFSYLDFLDKPTPENVKAVHKACGMTQPQVATMLGIGLQTYKGWHAPVDKDSHRTPHVTTWNLFLYELEARRLGYQSICDFFNKKHL